MKKQYIIQKYVMADSVTEAIKKAKTLPIHEVFLHNNWFEKAIGYEFYAKASDLPGFKEKQK